MCDIDQDESKEVFALRPGPFCIIFGSAVHRRKAVKEQQLTIRMTSSLDACHLTGPTRGIMTDQCQSGPENEICLDITAFDLENESNNTHAFVCECLKVTIGPYCIMTDRR